MRKSLLTSTDDLDNAGAVGLNEPGVIDGNLISSRTSLDLAPLARAMVDFLAIA